MINKLVFWLCETFLDRHLVQEYLGDGNVFEERGWLFMGRFISAEYYLSGEHGQMQNDATGIDRDTDGVIRPARRAIHWR